MELAPPVTACGALAKEIGTLVGLCGDAATFVLEPVDYADGMRYATFAELLVAPDVSAEVLFAGEPRFAASSPLLSPPPSSPSSPHRQQHAGSRQIFGFSADTSVPGLVISKIPFTHPRQLYSMLMHLRRQLTFNQLFRSCFNARTAAEAMEEEENEADDDDDDVRPATTTTRFVLDAWTPPERLEFAVVRSTAGAGAATTTTTTEATSVRRVAVVVDAQANVAVEMVVDSEGEETPRTTTTTLGGRVARLARVSLDLVLVFDELARVLWPGENGDTPSSVNGIVAMDTSAP
ncbi:hypothetical protein HDU87_006442 [Geranomyces variabilis]|uniref:Mediator of RNA polymerase II transcription subunit 1 n=1 Tax=Geranomyces variabilis TaxID=109894 RepID=A0AAD5TKP8_9FUNG|nr:hypothetical protein HDU87_006442 [Geranomyces variabilis]